TLNAMLAELLSESVLNMVGEVRVRRKMSGVQIDINGVRLIIEGKKVGHRDELYTNACRRIRNGLCDAVLMVEYVELAPEKQSKTLIDQKMIKQALKNSTFNVCFVTYVGRVGFFDRWIPQIRKKPDFQENVDFQHLVASLLITYDALVKENLRDKVVGYLGLLNSSHLPI
ncbi:MAG: hypothetical protein NWE83_13425, partial [Candidatus Bathyarchaeota archaeon]|nr:hypothetical protein [Candidatus Bathyarchaeota archaeon]